MKINVPEVIWALGDPEQSNLGGLSNLTMITRPIYYKGKRAGSIHRDYAEPLMAALSAASSPEQTAEQKFIADCAKEGMYRQLIEAVGDALDGQLSEEQSRWFPCARAVQQQREALDAASSQTDKDKP